MAYNELLAEDLRLVVLQALEQDPDFALNDYMLQTLLAQFSHAVGLATLHEELAWLASHQLIDIERQADVWIVSLLRRGEDVALGRERCDGVRRLRVR